MIRAKVDTYNDRVSVKYLPIRTFSNMGIEYPYREDNYNLL